MRRFRQLIGRGRLALHVMALLVFASALMVSGSAYAFCPYAKRVMRSQGCCAGKHQQAKKPAPLEIRRKSCCLVRSVDVLPSADTVAFPAAVAPTSAEGALEIAPQPAPTTWIRVAPAPPRAAVPIRAGPRTASERCILLQTFLR